MSAVVFMLVLMFVSSESYPLAHYLVIERQIFYKMDPDFSEDRRVQINKCIKEMEKKTCLVWRELDEEDDSYPVDRWAVFEWAWQVDCSANLQPRGATTIRLSKNCFEDQWVMYELMRALGFSNEHQRPDRNCYVQVDDSLVNNGEYNIMPWLDVSWPYDIHSVMHYRRSDDDDVKPADGLPDSDSFGSWDKLSDLDVMKLNFEFCDGPHYCEMHRLNCTYTVGHNRERGCVKTTGHHH